jgi:hypothetical protein
MYYYPPRGITQFSDDGRFIAQWLGDSTDEGMRVAKRQRRMSMLSPAMFALGFALQLVSALMQAWSPNAA